MRLIEFYERHYGYLATAILSAAIALALALTPLGAKAMRRIDSVFGPDDATGVGFFGKMMNDWGVRPTRFLYPDHGPPLHRYAPVVGDFASKRTAPPLVYSRDSRRDDAFVIVGAFEFEEGLHGAILIDRKGRILHRWPIPPAGGRKGFLREDYRVFPHGFALAPDGSAVIAFDNGARLIRIDACGRLVWRMDGAYHHVVEADPERPGEVWTWKARAALRLAAKDGRETAAVRMPAVEEANAGLDLFGVRERDSFDVSTPASDDVHLNDIDPLPAALAPAFPQFSTGDLLMSARSLNLVFVVDPDTRKVKWHANGYWRRQHDPDWGRDGRIYVYNNNMNRGPSSIVAIDPKTMRAETAVDGARYDFYSNIRGKQQWAADGRVVIASPQQGRAFEIDENGEISFEFLNRYDARSGESLVVSEAFRVDPATLDREALARCSGE